MATTKKAASKSSSTSTRDRVVAAQSKEAAELRDIQVKAQEDNAVNVPGAYYGEVRSDPDPSDDSENPKTDLLAAVHSEGNVLVVTVPKSPLRLQGEQIRAFERHLVKAGASL